MATENAKNRGRGRPKKEPEKVKNKTIKLRATEDEIKELHELTKWTKMTCSDTIRTLIKEAKNYYILGDQK